MPPKVNKIEVELKKLTKLDGNKTCADCPEKMPSYAELTHNIFVCTKCAGIHRDFQYKVKGLSMSVFSETDVAMLSSVGNIAFNSKYLANFNARDNALPNGSDIAKLKEFIRMKYMDKRWFSDTGVSNNSQDDRRSSFNGTTINKQSSISYTGTTLNKQSSASNSNSSFGLDLLSMTDTPVSKPTINNNSASFDPFSNNSTVPAQSSGMSSFDAFSSQPPQPPTSSFDAFGTSSATPSSNTLSAGGFDAFNSPSPAATSFIQQNPANGFSNFAIPQQPVPPVQTAPLPFIRLAPPPAAEPEPIKIAATNIVKHVDPKNFSAFDDLLDPVQQSNPIVPLNQNNPFGQPVINQSHSYPIYPPQQAQYPGYTPGLAPSYPGYPPQQQPGYPQQQPGFPPQQQPGYPQQQPGYPQQNPCYPQQQPGFPPQQQPGFPPQQQPGFPPQQQPGFPPQQQPGYPQQQPGFPPQQPGYPPQQQPGYAPQQAQQPKVEVNAAPDPFAAMSGVAWSQVGGASKPSATIPAPVTATVYTPTPAQIAPTSNPVTSVNPFDMF